MGIAYFWKNLFMSLWDHLFKPKHRHTKIELALIEIIKKQQEEILLQQKQIESLEFRIKVCEEHLWKCRHKEHGVRLDVVFPNSKQ